MQVEINMERGLRYTPVGEICVVNKIERRRGERNYSGETAAGTAGTAGTPRKSAVSRRRYRPSALRRGPPAGGLRVRVGVVRRSADGLAAGP